MPIYDTSTLGTSTNKITFNDDSTNPFYRLKHRTIQRRNIREFDIPLVEEMGVADFETFIGKYIYVLEGTMYPNDEYSFDTGKAALRKLASLPIEQRDNEADLGYVPYKWNENDGYNKAIDLKVIYVDMPENSRSGIKIDFRLFCKVKYPIIRSQTAFSTTIGDSSASTSGSSNLPWVLPKVVGKTSYSSNGSVINYGTLPAYPASITIKGPISVPKLTNTTTGEYIEVNTTLASASDTLSITYDQDSVSITNNGTSVLNLLTVNSTLFKIQSGTNNFTLSGATVGSGAYATVNFYAAWPLS